ncbi:putative hemagglutinin-related protein [Phaeoacremonium minimum UCRPA7]|uniref:Putative hemagglutinin-related protein n=1 Tax=Phaeoacremonium minimum (strain UCR-PA7) TaxID=1286976 RepID=R8BMI8_PHAM7|nr:putative hemagglutinin-related protein [Phaeoacremonium minimum UCRPA7]EOO00569.1 putative hemagglutinin-related protein [Phaeoacremonium minimum UCRPA7]
MIFPGVVLQFLVLPVALAVTVDYTELKDKKGNGIPDFSFCGYHASNDPLPDSHRAAAVTIQAASGDQSKQIQDALNNLSSSSGGGVIALAPGDYHLNSGLTIPRGSGEFSVITMGTKVSNPKPGTSFAITDKYVPVGATKVTVKDSTGLKVGQNVWVQRAVTAKWVRANGMADLVRDGEHQTWLTPQDTVYQPRIVKAISSNTVTLDIPLTDQLDSAYMSPKLVIYTPPSAPSELGVESMSITLSPSCSGKIITDNSCQGSALTILPWVTDSYARGLSITGFNNAVKIGQNSSRITIQSVSVHRDHATDNGAGYAADIAISGTQVLVIDSGTKGAADAKSFPIVTQGLIPGPNAVVRHFGQQPVMQIQPHAHWAHGLLVDNTTATTTLINRGTAGSGHESPAGDELGSWMSWWE